MRLQDLKTFQHVASTGNLHRAAQQCGLTQSAVTKIVQRLEQHFELPLIARAGRGIELTAAGKILQEATHAIDMNLSELDARFQALRSAKKGILRVGTVPALLETVLLPALASQIQSSKGLRFEATIQLSNALVPAVQDGRLDLALCFTPDHLPPDVSAFNLGTHEHKIVVRKGHPLTRGPVDEQLLAKSDWMLPASGVSVRTLLETYFADRGHPSLKVVVVTDASSAWLTSILHSTDLVTLMTEQMLRSDKVQGLVPLSFPTLKLSNSLCLIHRRNAYLPPALTQLRTAMAARFPTDTSAA